ncbi:MAG TPA: TIGR01620 family protein [Marinagarivorans sp.]|nr:TIGR01620 family protein [Cellvibrionaceae bacterium]HMY38552.1 TIGR01620 family protein [Marinagarivorans sp.]
MSLEPKVELNKPAFESPLRQAQLFTPEEAAPEPVRTASEFVPLQHINTPPAVTAAPEAISAGQIRLEALPLKGLKTAGLALGVLAAMALAWPLMQWLTWAFNLQPLLGVGLLMVITSLFSACGFSLLQLIKGQAQVKQLGQLQEQAEALAGHKTFGKARPFVAALQGFYAGKPQGDMLAEVLKSLPDYADDRETLAHIERGFLAPLDAEALRLINRYSSQTALAVAVSPWVSLDMALSLFRNAQMLSRIGELYGLRPSPLTRWRLLKLVVAHLIGTGASEWALDQAVDTLGLGAAQMVGLRATQGIGAGLYTAKIGLAAMDVCRPMGFVAEPKPVFKHLWEHLVAQVRGRFKI